jgi:GntR family transcriptional regulator/MocR family aminotransferase
MMTERGFDRLDRPVMGRGRILHVSVDPGSRETLYRQIYQQVRRAILNGTLPPGSTLPSSRALADDLGVSRATVMQAYEQLGAEGYVKGRVGAATCVTANMTRDNAPAAVAHHGRIAITSLDEAMQDDRFAAAAIGRDAIEVGVEPDPLPRRGRLSARGRRIEGLDLGALQGIGETPRAFRTGVPALDLFPTELWGRLLARRWRRSSPRSLGYGEPFGFLPLRKAIAAYLRSARGVRCEPEQVLICTGSQQAIDLTARVLLDPGDRVWMEDPGYPGVRNTLAGHEAEIVPVRVDAEGLDVAHGRALAPDARLAFVTPARQVPLGVALSLSRRLDLLRWAYSAGAWIFEDDYDGELRYTSTPLSSLQGLDENGHVIYAGTFSKLMFPALRLGYLVVPPALHDVFYKARMMAGFSSAYLEQAALTDFIAEGHFERHIRRMRVLYQTRQQLLVTLLRRRLSGVLDVTPTDAGVNLTAWLKIDIPDRRVAQQAVADGVDLLPISAFSHGTTLPPSIAKGGLLLGFGGVREPEIRDGVEKLTQSFTTLDDGRSLFAQPGERIDR